MKKSLGLQRNSYKYLGFFSHFLSFVGLIIYSFYEKEVIQVIFCKKYLFKKKVENRDRGWGPPHANMMWLVTISYLQCKSLQILEIMFYRTLCNIMICNVDLI